MKTLTILLAMALAGCSTVPTTIAQRVPTARPLPTEVAAPTSGAIFQLAAYRPLFEDRRARQVGDLLTVTILENTSAVKAGTSSGGKTGSASFSVAGPLQGRLGATAAATTDNKFSDNDNQTASNTFTGTIGVTVTEVLPNGNLIVAGEKQVAMNRGVEFIRFSGMVSPDLIGQGNTVSSTQVADARVEYRTNSQIDRAEMTSMMSRFFQSLLPF